MAGTVGGDRDGVIAADGFLRERRPAASSKAAATQNSGSCSPPFLREYGIGRQPF